ncbi:hypothetical protein BB561_001057 [Smittium simulii]|uniref:Uncharacterized protein n=1 Tax=Smittium simulii TaxID=133385 RepID=A0A2T9YWF1_9FUNG|nr:hypothetical protein BB561_001057 [Smittium simulii]
MPKTLKPSRSDSISKINNSQVPIKKISIDDYYRLNAPFSRWLLHEKSAYFDELPSKKTKKYFKIFVNLWNNSYYNKNNELLNPSSVQKFTRYKWSFSKKGNSASIENKDSFIEEDKNLNSIKIQAQREYLILKEAQKKAQIKYDRNLEELIEDVTPKEPGRAALIAEKKARNRIHHADKDYDIDVHESVLMGESDFKQLLVEEQLNNKNRDARKYKKPNVDSEKLQKYLEKENSTVEFLRQLAKNNAN